MSFSKIRNGSGGGTEILGPTIACFNIEHAAGLCRQMRLWLIIGLR